MKNRVFTVAIILVFAAGLSLLLYPTVSSYYNAWLQSQIIVDYAEKVDQLENEAYKALWEEAELYNAALAQNPNAFALPEEMAELYPTMLQTSASSVMAYVEIPSIGVTLPIAHGTEEDTLQKVVGHLEWSSLPIGGESTHCVISGHRGLPSSELFTNIDHLETGDVFYIHVLGQTLEYLVDNIIVVEPYDFSPLAIEEGKDYVTLLTCTPYGINSHRLLVRGVRAGTVTEKENLDLQIRNEVTPMDRSVLVSVVLTALALLAFGITAITKGRKGPKHEKK